MSPRSTALWTAAALAFFTLLLGWMGTPEAQPLATSMGLHPGGLRGAGLLAEDLGVPVASWQSPLSKLDPEPGAVLVITLPIHPMLDLEDDAAIGAWLQAGGVLVVQSSGDAVFGSPIGVDSHLGLHLVDVTLHPEATIAELAQPVVLPSQAAEGAPGVVVPRAQVVFGGHAEDVVHYGGVAQGAVRQRPLGAGQVWLFDGPALSNRWVARSPANTQVWQEILADAPRVWFDDYHQGVVAVDALAAATPTWPFDLLIAHICVLWALGVWALGRPIGPSTRPSRIAPPSSVAQELTTLARIHAHHHHAEEAAAQLHASTAAANPTATVPAPPSGSVTDLDFLHYARDIGALQRAGRLR